MEPKLWPEYEEIVNGAVNELEADNELFLEVLTTHRAMFGPEADSGNATEKFIAELLDNAPSLDIRALMVGETVVDWDNGYTRFKGTYTARELVQLLRKEELLVERGRDVYDDFLDSSEQYRKVTEDVFDGGVWEEIDLSNLLGANRRLREEFASAQPHRVLPALKEHDAQAYEAVLNLEKPAVSNDFIDLVVETRDELFSEPFSPEALRRTGPAQVKPRVPLEPGAPAPDVVTDNTRRVVEPTPLSVPRAATVDPNRGDRFAALSPEAQPAGQVRPTSPQTEEQRIAEGNRLFALNEMGYDLGPGTSGDDGSGGDVPDGDVPDGVPTPSVTFGTAANQAEVQRLLEERFGGLAFFLDKHEDTLQVGITESGEIVAASDPAAVTTKHVVDVLVEQGIVAPNLILGVVQKTQWYQETDAKMREHDVLVANMTDREKEEYLDPVMDILRDEAVYLGIGGTVTDKTLSEAANEIMRQGESGDMDFIRGSIIRWSKFDAAQSEASEFAALSDTVFALSKRYFTPIGSELSNKTAQQIYLGNQTLAGQEQLFRDQAKAAMPMLANAIDAGITPEQYFAPYKYRMEQILGRPNIDLYEDFPQVVSHIGDNGEMRPMTLSEMDRFARGLPEWQQSVQGQDAARSLSFAIGRTFGEVA